MGSDTDAQFIVDLKEKIASSKTQKSRYEGQLDELLATMKKQFSFSTVEESRLFIEKSKKQLSALEVDFNKVVEKLKEAVKE